MLLVSRSPVLFIHKVVKLKENVNKEKGDDENMSEVNEEKEKNKDDDKDGAIGNLMLPSI